MLEEQDQEPHEIVGEEKISEAIEKESGIEKNTEPILEQSEKLDTADTVISTEGIENATTTVDAETAPKAVSKITDQKKEQVTTTQTALEKNETSTKEISKEKDSKEDVLQEEIDETNAEDAEDEHNKHRHSIPFLDYHAMSMENLVGELQKLIKSEKIQAIKKHVDDIKHEFDLKFQEFLGHKKEEFISSGGNEIDFNYNSVTKKQFNEVFSDYREKRNQYYKDLEKNLKTNLDQRLKIIEELKSLINVDEDINTTYKNFKNIQEEWRNAGPVPRTQYNNVWRTYHHHIEIFYDFLHLNRELRDLDFKHNLEEKMKLIIKAEELAQEKDLGKAFRQLQTLHKVWKEDIGPVGKEHREEIWDRFSNATKAMHARRQEYYKDLDKVYEENLIKKNKIIDDISLLAANISDNHKGIQQQIKQIETLRDGFFKGGKVPQKVNESTWVRFKDAVRNFNSEKNKYYKGLKKEQQENLDKKRSLLDLALSLKDNEDGDTATNEMKRIQNEWKKIGHVPRKYSDKLWNEFKNACNHYFDRIHALKNEANKDELENFEKKNACLERLRAFELSGDKKKDITAIKVFIEEWKNYGRVPFNKKNINVKFNKILDAIFKKLDISKQESELLKYGNKIQQFAQKDNEHAIYKERVFIRRKIDESKVEIRQLENNMQFFSNASEDNPLVKDVVKNISKQKDALETWMAKLKKLNILKNNLNKETEEVVNTADSEEE